MASFINKVGQRKVEDNTINQGTDTLTIALFTSGTNALSTAAASLTTIGSVTNQVSGGGYAPLTLASVTVTLDDPGRRVIIDSADALWSSVTMANVVAAVIYSSTAGSQPLVHLDLGGAQSVTAANFTVVFDANGWKQITELGIP